MTTTRLRSLSLSLALHGAVLAGLLFIASGRTPDEMPAGIAVVWLDTGLADLAAASRGDAGVADDGEPDPAAEPLPDPIVTVDAPDRPAPPRPDARDPTSGADRPAPPPTESEEEPRLRTARAPPEPSEPHSEPTGPEAEPTGPEAEPSEPRAEPPRASAEARRSSAGASAEAPELPADRSAALAGTAEASAALPPAADASRPLPRAVDPSATPPRAADASAEAQPASRAEPPAEPVSADEREMLLAEVMDLVDRSRELPSKPSVAWSRDGREYRAELARVLSAGATGIEEAVIEVATELDGRHVSTEMRMKRLAFSHYAQFIDRWDPDVQIHDDEIDGRFHSNTEIVITSSGGIQPVFRGKVTTTGGIDTTRSDRRVRRNQVFLGGVETRVPRIALPRRFAPLEALAADAGDIVALEQDSRITFFADGAYEIDPTGRGRCGDAPGVRRSGRLGASPTYFVAAEKCAVAVKGTVNGKVLVYSPVEIVIEGDLVYAADPRRAADADDYLGLVSDGTVEIADPDVTGPGDLSVHAAIYARRLFAVRRYSRGERATLVLYGSLTAGSLTATEPRYRTKLEFDPRLEHARPPSFPMTDRYELASWDGVWRPIEE
ncbi:MAG TPA: hypothetical protein VF339_08705 [Gammaproteobacteria bacterium]